jgi:hypothetical protein
MTARTIAMMPRPKTNLSCTTVKSKNDASLLISHNPYEVHKYSGLAVEHKQTGR